MQQHRHKLQLLIACLLMSMIPISAQAPESYIIAIWTFDQDRNYESGKQLDAEFNRQQEPATLTMLEGDIDSGARSGIAYTDNTCGVTFDPSFSVRWDKVEGNNSEDAADDAQLRLTFSTIDWEDLALRFFYKSEQVESFDISYHLGDEDWKHIVDDVQIDDDDEWRNIEVGLQDIDDIENREKVVFLIHDMIGQFTEGNLFLDNVAILGQRISSPIDCPPVLQAMNPVNDISILLNSDTIPTFMGDDGFQFLVTDDKTSFEDMTIVALTSDPNVVNQLGLTVVNSDNGIFQLEIGSPHGYTGVANITLRVTDTTGNSVEQVIQYGVSAVDGTSVYHQGMASATAGIAIDDNYMVVANNDNQIINVYSRNQTGQPVASLDVTTALDLRDHLGDGTILTVDIEAGTRLGNRQYWIGSHSNDNRGDSRFNRNRLFATEIQGQGDNIELTFVGYTAQLFDHLVAWDGGTYGFRATLTGDIPPNRSNGFNIEGLAIAPDGQTAYIGLRTPIVGQSKSLLVPILNFETWFGNGNPTDSPQFGDAIELDLGGLGMRGIECNTNGCLIIAGAINEEDTYTLYSWSGNAGDAPVLRSVDLTDLQPQSIVLSLNQSLSSGSTIQMINNDRETDWYHTGGNTTNLSPSLRFFRTIMIPLD